MKIKKVFNKKITIKILSLVLMVWISSADGAVFQGKVSDLQVSGNADYFSIAGVSYTECAKNKRYIFNAGTALWKETLFADSGCLFGK
jgi:hypothetical protein